MMEKQAKTAARAPMKGQTVVITGGTSGIGEVAGEILATKGARIVVVARDKIRGKTTLARLRTAAPGVTHSIYFADLTRLAEIKRVAVQIADQEPRIDVLINNAGALFARRQVTEDGLEFTFALNHMAYFVLTEGLRERLLASPPARIINTASAAHEDATLDFDDLQSAKNYRALKAYSRSKLCNILFTRELARRLRGVTANCLHPGFVATRFGDQSGGPIAHLLWLAKSLPYRLPKVPEQSSISRLRRTWIRRRGNTSTSVSRPRRRRRHATTDLLRGCGSAT